MAAENSDAEYLDRMLRLNPLGDTERILAERAAYLANRDVPELASSLIGLSPVEATRGPDPASTGTSLLLPGWQHQRRVVQAPFRRRGRWRIDVPGWWESMGRWRWIWVAVVLANLLRTILTTNK